MSAPAEFSINTIGGAGTNRLRIGGGVATPPVLNGAYTGAMRMETTDLWVAANSSIALLGGAGVSMQVNTDSIRVDINGITGQVFGTSTIDLVSDGSGDVNINATGGGNIDLTVSGTLAGDINILQNQATNPGNIRIENYSTTAGVGESDLYLTANSQIIIRKQNTGAYSAPSIVLDYDATGLGVPSTRFTGIQTWGTTDGSSVSPIANVQQFNDLEGVVDSSIKVFRQTGSTSLTDMTGGAFMEKWIAGYQPSLGRPSGVVGVALGSEGTLIPDFESGGTTNISDEAMDNRLELTVRDENDNLEYFTASKSKLGLGSPLVHKRSRGLNDVKNNAPFNTATQTGAPAANNYIEYGWSTNANTSTTFTTGMPTVDELNVPYITLGYGQNITGNQGTGVKIRNYDKTFHFPTGAYPGQQLILRIMHCATEYSAANMGGGTDTYLFYGDIEIKVPVARRKNLSPNTWQSWYDTYNAIQNYYPILTTTNVGDANNCIIKSGTYMLIWDGSVLQVPGSNNQFPNSAEILVQTGWIIHPIAAESFLAHTGNVYSGPPA